jgi:hypothetical protein
MTTFQEWLSKDTVAILCTAIYYGVPSQGHTNCYEEMIREQHPRMKQVSLAEPGIHKLHCIGCGEPLIQKQAQNAALD